MCVCCVRVCVCVGPAAHIVQRLSQYFMSRRARWAQALLTEADAAWACSLDFCELLRLGYFPRDVRRAWIASRGHDPFFALGLKVLVAVESMRITPSAPTGLDPHVALGLEGVYCIPPMREPMH